MDSIWTDVNRNLENEGTTKFDPSSSTYRLLGGCIGEKPEGLCARGIRACRKGINCGRRSQVRSLYYF